MCHRRVIYSGTMRGPEATKTRPDASWATTIHEFVNRIFPPPVPPRTRSRHGHVSRVTREPTASPLLLLLLLLARTAPHNRPIDEKRLHGWNKLTRAEMTEYPTAITKYTVLRERAKTERKRGREREDWPENHSRFETRAFTHRACRLVYYFIIRVSSRNVEHGWVGEGRKIGIANLYWFTDHLCNSC